MELLRSRLKLKYIPGYTVHPGLHVLQLRLLGNLGDVIRTRLSPPESSVGKARDSTEYVAARRWASVRLTTAFFVGQPWDCGIAVINVSQLDRFIPPDP